MNREDDATADKRTDEEDDTRRRFREALERKKASGHAHLGPQAESGAHVKGSNTRQRREFRRKSG